MRYTTARVTISLIITLLTLSCQTIHATDWPIHRKIDLSSGFGDFRANRFHTGIDLRTGGKVGTAIYAPVSGYIHRVRTSYSGYGKGLYLKGDDGFIYVFGHLLDFHPQVDSLLKSTQRKTKRYFQDIQLQKDEIRVAKGDFIGYTGQTGAGAPHLHFEKRTADNKPLNPLTNGFTIDDKVRPVFSKIGFKMLHTNALYDNGFRELEFKPILDSLSQNYFLDTLIYFHQPFGVFAGVYDQMKQRGMSQSVYKLTLNIDNEEYYAVKFDKLDFDKQKAVNFRYEYTQAINNEKRVQRLYDYEGHDFDGSSSKNKSNGIIDSNNLRYGHHKGEIIAEDAFGNKRSLFFSFIYGPEEELFQLDSHIVFHKKENLFYFTPSIPIAQMQIDSVLPYMNRGELWGKAKGATIEHLANGQLLCKTNGNVRATTLRLFLFSKKALIRDNLFSGVISKGKLGITFSYNILEDGLLFNLKVKARQSSDARIELYYKDSLLDVLYPELFNMTTYKSFIHASEKYEHIDKVGFAMSRDTIYLLQYKDSLKIHLVGHKDKQEFTIKGLSFEFNKKNFYKPRFVSIDKKFFLKDNHERLISQLVEISPLSFLCKSNFKINYSVNSGNTFYERTGISWFNEKDKKWVWLDNQREEYDLTSESTGGGIFAVLYDLEPPVLKNLNIIDSKSYPSKNFKVTFLVKDLLSGIPDDQAFHVKLDKEWLIPEYDPETNRFIARPEKELSAGKHYLAIEVYDGVGNKTEQYLNFYVKKSKSRAHKTR